MQWFSKSRWRTRLALACLCAVLPVAADAADAKGQFATKGVGALSCRQFADDRSRDGALKPRFRSWLDGYLTAVNRYEANTYDAAPWASGEVFATIIERHCQQNPEERYAQAVQRLVLSVKEDRLTRRSPLRTVTASGQSTVIYDEVLRLVQVQLADRGLYAGRPDGVFGPRTQDAIATFQISEGLDGTGLPDPLTVWKLLQP